jgi:hypothetical protein
MYQPRVIFSGLLGPLQLITEGLPSNSGADLATRFLSVDILFAHN